MKKLFIALTIVIAFSFLSCGTQNQNNATKNDESEQASQDDRRARMKEAIAKVKYDVPDEIDINYEVLDNIDTSPSPLGVVPIPEELGKTLNGLFSKYTKHIAPNGKPIHIFAQSGVSDLQVVRAREILKYHLTDAPGTQYGHDKTALANRMADVRATLMYTDTEIKSFAMRPILRDSELRLQDLYATESPVEGSYEYIHNQGSPGERYTRDASYEEIMHLVHDKGLEDILPDYHQEIVEAEKAAVAADIYHYGRLAPHEYIITGFDIYFGLWEHNPQGDGTSFGDEYPFHTKAEMKAGDPALYDLVEKFWPKYLTYNAYIDPSFEGIFSLVRDEDVDYTFKSQYLINIILTGENHTNILGNDQDNRLTGNDGDNNIIGNMGDDSIDGGKGEDTAEFSGNIEEYEVTRAGNRIIVFDTVPDRDGKDELTGIEFLKFKNKRINMDDAQISESAKTHLGGCILMYPAAEAPANLYQESGIIATDEYKPFTKKLSVYGITLIGRDDISDDFMLKVAKTIKELFPQNQGIDSQLQKEVLSNMYEYKAVIPLFQGENYNFSPEDQAAWDITFSKNSICDIIMENVPGQVNEVVEHILHYVTDVGLHYTFPDEWGISTSSKLYQVMQEAIDKEYFNIGQYRGINEEEKNRVLLQEYAYWIIYCAWDLRERYGPQQAEWSIMSSAELKAKLPRSYALFEQTIPRVMNAPKIKTLEEFIR